MSRLVTFVDVHDDVAGLRRMSISARHEALLVNGRRVVLLDHRGWSCSLGVAGSAVEDGSGRDSKRESMLDIWAMTSVEEIVETARTVVGPDEPFNRRSRDDMAADHWGHLTDVLRQQGLVADAMELEQLPHDVVLSERLLARVRPGDAVQP